MLLNSVYWSIVNPYPIHEVPLHDVKFSVWCAMNTKRIIGPIFYVESMNSDRYVRLIWTKFFAQLTEGERSYGIFSDTF
jgi:hypothetical protein